MADRIQMRRTKGWRKPEGAVYVGRPSKWGNPFRIGAAYCLHDDIFITPHTAQEAVMLYRAWIDRSLRDFPDLLDELRGKDLACWCPLDAPCHADVLLELANAAPGPDADA